jgi:membrane protein YqaA with SNARE-associated domain
MSPDPVKGPSSGDGLYEVPVASAETRTLIRKTLGSLVAVVVVAALAGWLFHDALVVWGTRFVDAWGVMGLAVSVLLIDASPIPLTNEPVVALALKGGLAPVDIFVVTSLASCAAGLVGFGVGTLLRRTTDVAARVRRWNPLICDWIERRGAVAVAVAAIAPLPYALSTYTAGLMGVRLGPVALATLVRIPKTALYLLLLMIGFGGEGLVSSP